MKTSVLFLLLLTCCATLRRSYAGPLPEGRFAFENVTVIPMNDAVSLPHQTVLVENGIIRKTGAARGTVIPPNYTIIDGRGKFLVPGLWDMHAHFFYEQGANKNTCALELKMMLANGLTTARIECGDTTYLQAREKVRSNEWNGPELYVSSPQFVGAWPWPGPVFAAVCKTPYEAENAVRKFKAEGYDEIKITFMVKRDVYDAIIRTAAIEGIKVTGHVGPLVKLPAALAAREQIEHMDEFIDMLLPDSSYNHGQSVSDMNIWRKKAWETVPFLQESKINSLVSDVKASGIYVTPTNFFMISSFGEEIQEAAYKNRPDYAFIPLAIRDERWAIRDRYWKSPPPESSRRKFVDLRKKMTYALWKAGVPLMAGSDSPEWFLVQGFSIHDELETFVKAGLTPFAALQTATVNPARYAGVDKRKGTIEEGKIADLILLDKDPMADIRNTRTIRGVLHQGKWYDKPAIDDMLSQAAELGN